MSHGQGDGGDAIVSQVYVIHTLLALSRAVAEYCGFHLGVLLFSFSAFPLDLLYFPPNSAFWHLPAGAGFWDRWHSYSVKTAVVSAKTPADESGKRTQNWFLIAGFALNFLALKSFFSRRKREVVAGWYSSLEREPSCVLLSKASRHRPSSHLLKKSSCVVGRGEQSSSRRCCSCWSGLEEGHC